METTEFERKLELLGITEERILAAAAELQKRQLRALEVFEAKVRLWAERLMFWR